MKLKSLGSNPTKKRCRGQFLKHVFTPRDELDPLILPLRGTHCSLYKNVGVKGYLNP
jgi:hypothetical protein